MFDKKIYNSRYFAWHDTNCRIYSILTMDHFLANYGETINSIVDFGCGIGSYLEAAFTLHHINKLKGYDISPAAKEFTPDFIQQFVEYTDCCNPMELDKYDLVLSFETAEHIEPSGTDQFIRNLVSAKAPDGIILFSAAPPGQDGGGHINCQPKQFWIDKFAEHGLQVQEDFLKIICEAWPGLGAPDYICKNLLILK